jgi:glucokinase
MISESSALLGVDVGATTMSAGIVTTDGTVRSVVQAATYRDGPGTILDTLLDLVGEQLSWAEDRRVAVEAIGVGLPGVVDTDGGTLRRGVHLLPELSGVPLAARLTVKTGIPVFVDNDVNAVALGEWTWGHGRGARSLAVLAIGTGVGGALVVDGRVVRGQSGHGGEFGHVPVALDGRRCSCGSKGCLAAYVGGAYLAEEAERRARAAIRSESGGDHQAATTTRMVFEAAAAGEPVARAIVDEATRALGAGLAGIVNGFNPDVIIVTGGVVGSLLPLRDEILGVTGEYALTGALAGTRIHFVAGDKNKTVRGGAALVLYERGMRAATRWSRTVV